MSDYFPQEIQIEILKRLSIQDAVRCITVCKSWYSLITSPSFISIHSQHHQIASSSTNNNNGLVLVRDYHSRKPNNKDLFSLHYQDESFGVYRHLRFPFTSVMRDSYLRVVGCVNGVVCLSDDLNTYTNVMLLWNPSIGKFINLPRPIFTFTTHGGFDHRVGFGFDDVTNDFKVVRVVYLIGQRMIVPPKVEIYEPRVGSWRQVDSKGFSRIIDEKSPQVFLHGNVHWVIGCKDEYDFFKARNTNNLIVSFDLRSEEFRMMKVPDSLNEPEFRQIFCVSVLGESLSLIHETRPKHGSTCCIWVMKQYGVPDSWTKLFRIDSTGGTLQVLGFQRNGEALVKASSMYHGYLRHLLSCEPKSGQLKTLAPFGGDWKPLYVENFVETLALLGVKGKSLPPDESDDQGSPDESSCEPEDESRFMHPANPSTDDDLPPVRVEITWFD